MVSVFSGEDRFYIAEFEGTLEEAIDLQDVALT